MSRILVIWVVQKTWIDPAYHRCAEVVGPEAHQTLANIDSQSRVQTPAPPRSDGAPATVGLKQQGTLDPSRKEHWEPGTPHPSAAQASSTSSIGTAKRSASNPSKGPQASSSSQAKTGHVLFLWSSCWFREWCEDKWKHTAIKGTDSSNLRICS